MAENLYGQRPAKKPRRELPLSDTLDFASQLRSLIAKPKTTTKTNKTASATPLVFADPAARPPRDDLAHVRVKKRKVGAEAGAEAQAQAQAEAEADPPESNRLRLKAPAGIDAADRERIRRSMQAKARRYAALKRGEEIPREGDLVEFEEPEEENSEEENSDSDSGEPTREYVDEFGRTRQLSRTAYDRAMRRRAVAEKAARDLEEMRARPAAPAVLLHGDVIQTEAIAVAPTRAPEDKDEQGDTHYRADEDIRTRGAAFYAFATDDEQARAAQMQALADARTRTEAARAQHTEHADARQQKMHERRRLMDERRRQLAERRAHRMADNFLQGLEQDMAEAEERTDKAEDRTDKTEDKTEVEDKTDKTVK